MEVLCCSSCCYSRALHLWSGARVAPSQVSVLSRLPGALKGATAAWISPDKLMRSATYHFCCPTVRKSGIWVQRLVRLCIYGLGTFRKNKFHLFCLQIALIPEKIGFHIACIKTKESSFWHRFFFCFGTANPSRFWFGFEIGNKVTTLTFVAVWD